MAVLKQYGNVIEITDFTKPIIVRLPFGLVDGYVSATNPVYFGEKEGPLFVGNFPVVNCNGYPSVFYTTPNPIGSSMMTISIGKISPAANPNYGEDFARLYPASVEEVDS